ncbi:hypothetical protein L6270_02520 [Candidatus Parcubacteria bacterium]|nr:hypothetical protein [Patescibacteria group bacterium]MBU4309532.1 hypothetical protein [Patescibacteria group bacterium]MBU4432353.1 hypothetical protein [Patescibacteria group bacterium]MBU4577238.1 hypothetical protein [Patescibacteria group bacterium]MCG2696884.1 hypothetical protein [Candidatus Parcubacteria bacterium]
MPNQKSKLAGSRIAGSTQQYLDIAEIKDNVVVLRDGTLRAVILVSSINFALKSEDEQNAIISAYVGFLNNIDFPLQVVIQSRELNIDAYLDSIRKIEKEQTNELLKIQTADYVQYVGELISMSKIMKKSFYVVVPYNPLSDKQKGFVTRLSEVLKPAILIRMKEEKFQRRKADLMKRVDNVLNGLSSIGLGMAVLDTQSLIELYYNTYNPTTAKSQEMVDVGKLRID